MRIFAAVLATVLMALFVIRPAIRDLRRPERATSELPPHTPKWILGFVPIVLWFRLAAGVLFVVWTWYLMTAGSN